MVSYGHLVSILVGFTLQCLNAPFLASGTSFGLPPVSFHPFDKPQESLVVSLFSEKEDITQ